jgi:hypothetical protein
MYPQVPSVEVLLHLLLVSLLIKELPLPESSDPRQQLQ